jgi:hypothetical protein
VTQKDLKEFYKIYKDKDFNLENYNKFQKENVTE